MDDIYKSVRKGILGTGNMACVLTRGIANSSDGEFFAVASRKLSNAQSVGQEFNVPYRYGSYEAIIADPKVQGVYIAFLHVGLPEIGIKTHKQVVQRF